MSDTNIAHAGPHTKIYIAVGISLLVLTVVTVLVSVFDFTVPVAIAVGLIIATVKGSLVALFFMHLSAERALIYVTLLLTIVFFLALLLIPVFSLMDSYAVDPIYVP